MYKRVQKKNEVDSVEKKISIRLVLCNKLEIKFRSATVNGEQHAQINAVGGTQINLWKTRAVTVVFQKYSKVFEANHPKPIDSVV